MNARAKLSSKGQIVIPKSVRDAHGWRAGTEFEILDDGVEVTLRVRAENSPVVPQISKEAFLALIPEYRGPEITDEMIDRAVVEETRRRWHAKRG